MSFAEFSLHHFLNSTQDSISHYSVLYNRLILNPSQLSYENVDKFIETIRKYKPLFLKGSPSTVYIFSILLEKKGLTGYPFKAILTTGEVLCPYQRERIKKIFNCEILDSYGQMEAVVAICQCEKGKYHLNSEYGLMELEKDDKLSSKNTLVGKIIGTSLYNFAMPFIRYRLDDLIELAVPDEKCPCGRTLPVVDKIYGRSQDIIRTIDGRFLTNLFIISNFIKGISWMQIIQESMHSLVLKIVPGLGFTDEEKTKLLKLLKNALGEEIAIKIKELDYAHIDFSQKIKNVISYVEPLD